ncbi:MAG: hypothetical protein U0457_09355 [Candidatus Sericytochromatia bacterium]
MKLKILAILLPLLITSCVPKEMVSVDPEFNFKNYKTKKVLFTAFDVDKDVKLPDSFKEAVENSLYKEFSNINNVKFERYQEKEKITKENIKDILEKNNASLVAVATIKGFSEAKFIDSSSNQPLYSDNSILYRNSQLASKLLVKYQVSLLGTINFVNNEGKVIWSTKLDDYQALQFEENYQESLVLADKSDAKIYSSIKDRLIDTVTQKVMRFLLPYYVYN